MKNMIVVRTSLMAIAILLFAGCASVKPLADGTWVEAVTVKDGLDRSATIISNYSVDGVTEDGKLVNPKLVKPRDVAVGPTVAGQAIVGAVSGGVTAGVTALGTTAAARIMSDAGCRGSNCGNNFYIQGGSAAALSKSGASAAIDANIGAGPSCIGGCLAQ